MQEEELVILEFWNAYDCRLSIAVRWNGMQFVFEGRRRATGALAVYEGHRHTYFPFAEPEVEIGSKSQAIEFLEHHLHSWDCPLEILDRVTTTLANWNA